MLDDRAPLVVTADSFVPFNDSPRHMVARVHRPSPDRITIAGTARYHLEGWYNVGARTGLLSAESCKFSVKARARKNLGAYSLGMLGENGVPRINISHFLRSSVSLARVECPPNFYSGFGYTGDGERLQHGVQSWRLPTDEPHELSVEYRAGLGLLSCASNGRVIQEVSGRLDAFTLEVRLEAIGVEGEFQVDFEDLRYVSFSETQTQKVASSAPAGGASVPMASELDSRSPELTALGIDGEASAVRDSTEDKGVEIFLSYSHQDERLRQKLDQHLSVLRRQGLIHVWNDRQIVPGGDFEKEISSRLETADVILLLVSAAFTASDYCWGKEMKRAIERHDTGTATVIPIILRPCDWRTTPFGKLKALPRDGKPIASTSWPNIDSGCQDVTTGVREVVTTLRRKS